LVKESDDYDYSRHLHDPDLLVDWEKIEEIQVDSHEPISCPICLYEPCAAKMTKCGHVYCWACILHYLSLSDKSWRKCPICFDSIYKKDLKSVRVNKKNKDYRPGDQITLNLMFKPKTKFNNLILPVSGGLDQYLIDEKSMQNKFTISMFDKPVYARFSQYFKLHCRTDQQIFDDVIGRERVELNKQAEAEKNQPEVCFIIF
jgi:hypothetical protein